MKRGLFCLKGVIYNIPVRVWLPELFPMVTPIVFVVPTDTMRIAPSPEVNADGLVTVTYLENWNYVSMLLLV